MSSTKVCVSRVVEENYGTINLQGPAPCFNDEYWPTTVKRKPG